MGRGGQNLFGLKILPYWWVTTAYDMKVSFCYPIITTESENINSILRKAWIRF